MRKRKGLHALGRVLPDLVKPAFGARGSHDGGLFLHWVQIVGEDLAKMCAPERLTQDNTQAGNTTLVLRVTPGAILFVESYKPQILESVHRYYGCARVQHLRFLQAPLPQRASPPKMRALDGVLPEEEKQHVEKIPCEALRKALLDLGKALYPQKRERAQDT